MRLFHISQNGGYKGLIELADFIVFDGPPPLMPQIKPAKTYSYEKAVRLAKFYDHNPRVRSSFQTDHDRKEEQYGGAFLVQCQVPDLSTDPALLLMSISGIGEMEDEAIGIATMVGMPWKADPRYIGDVQRASKNNLARQLLELAYA